MTGFDRVAIGTHIRNLHHAAKRADVPGGKLCLAVYGEDPDTGEKTANVQHFAIEDVDGMTAAAMAFAEMPHQNVYAPYVIFKPETAVGTRQGADIAAVLALVVDGDADKGKEAPKAPLAADYVIESSAGNFQEVLWLDRPVSPDEAKAYGIALKRATGADAANDIGHVWRVPGTLNWPNAVKIKRGRAREPQPVRVTKPWDKWTSVDALRGVLEPHWQEPRSERRDVAPSLDGYRLEEVSWWIDRKKEAGDLAWGQGDWAMFGGALKLHFGSDGLELFQRMSDDPDQAARRFDKFDEGYREGNRTLHWYLDRDVSWMFRHVVGCPKPPPGEVMHYEIPAEILAQMVANAPDLLQSSGEFVRGYMPPDYIIDGMFMRGYLYTYTAKTGGGKTAVALLWAAHVALGRSIGALTVEQGDVIYACLENEMDVRGRWVALCHGLRLDPDAVPVHFIYGVKLSQIRERVAAEVERKGLNPVTVMVDTVQASFEGDNDNDNVQMLHHAREVLRPLSRLPGNPAVLALAHPIKSAKTFDDLVPKGGGALLNEIDGNVGGMNVDGVIGLQTVGKFRGPDIPPIRYKLKVIRDLLRDRKGRFVPTVIAEVMSDEEAAKTAAAKTADEDKLLLAIGDNGTGSEREWAKACGWHHSKVQRLCEKFEAQKLLQKTRKGWQVTGKGSSEIADLECARQARVAQTYLGPER